MRRATDLQPDVITLDVLLPGKDGWAVLTALKADRELADIPVIMTTVLDEKKMGFALGAADYLTKPIDWERLGRLLDKYRKNSASVLVVEDDAAIRDMLQRTLAKQGWNVALAANGRLGLEELQRQSPSLILLDLMNAGNGRVRIQAGTAAKSGVAANPGGGDHGKRINRRRSPHIERTGATDR